MKHYKWILGAVLLVAVVISSCDKDDDDDPYQIAYENADISLGGIMYDKFWSTEAGFDPSNPNLNTLNGNSDFFRCKQCHAWDGLGNAGSYINRGPKTTRPTVSDLNLYQLAKTKTSKELFEAMKATQNRRDITIDLSTYDPVTNNTEGDKMPNLNQLLTDEQIWDIVKFMKEGMFDVDNLYDATYTGSYPTGSATYTNIGLDGDATAGNAYYTANCVVCHGSDGKTLTMEGKSLGAFIRSKPNEVQHKVKYGQLGSNPAMVGEFDITLGQMKDLYKATSNATDFPD